MTMIYSTRLRRRLGILLLLGTTSTFPPIASLLGADCNQNGRDDLEDLDSGTSLDCNLNREPDECEVLPIRVAQGAAVLPTDEGPRVVLGRDLDGDGAPELIVGNQSGSRASTVSVSLNRSDGTFQERIDYPAGERLTSLASADLDGDGDFDLVSAHSTALQVFENPGDGTLLPLTTVEVSQFTRFVTTGEMNGDDSVDLIVLNTGNDSLGVLFGQSDRTYNLPVWYSIGDRGERAATGDLDGDGDTDVVTANRDSGSLRIFRNVGEGTLSAETPLPMENRANSVSVVDVDGDGHLDLVGGTLTAVFVFRNPGDGVFAEADRLDVGVRAFATLDFDDDDDVDLLVAHADGRQVVFLAGDGNGRFTNAAASGIDFDYFGAADFDGDGGSDVVLADASTDEAHFLWSGSGTLSLRTEIIPAPGPPHHILLRDLDGDSYPEIVTPDGPTPTASLSVHANLAGGSFAPPVTYPLEEEEDAHIFHIDAGDIDSDSDLDVIATDSRGSKIHTLLNAGDGRLTRIGDVPVGAGPTTSRLADFNANGHLDVVAVNQQVDAVTFLFGDGTGAFAKPVQVAVDEGPWGLAVADFDGDSDVDVVSSGSGAQNLSFLRNDGLGAFEWTDSTPMPGALHYLASADLDRDGDTDVVALGGARVAMFLNSGNGSFVLGQVIGFSGGYSVTTADITQDGFVDVITTHWGPDVVSIHPGRGDGTFSRALSFPVGALSKFADVADLDLDGDLDMVSANRIPENISIFYNLMGTVAAGESFLETICTSREFLDLSNSYGDSLHQREIRYILPVAGLPGAGELQLAFQNGRAFASHEDFLRFVAPDLVGDLGAEAFAEHVLRREARTWFAGSVRRLRVDGRIEHGFDILTEDGSVSEVPSQAEVLRVHAELSRGLLLVEAGKLGYAPRAPEAREAASAWNDVGVPIFLVEPPDDPEPEPAPEGNPTFELVIPEDAIVCGTFAESTVDRGVREEYELQSQIRLRSGSVALPTVDSTFEADLFEDVRFGPAQAVAEPLGTGTFRVLRLPGADGIVAYRFTYEQAFVLPDGRSFDLGIVSPLVFRGRGDDALDGPMTLSERFFTRITGTESLQGRLDGRPLVRYGSCSYDHLPLVEVRAELAEGTKVRLLERFEEAENLAETAPAIPLLAEVDFGDSVRRVEGYWNLIYSALRHNRAPTYWILFRPPLPFDGIEREIHGLELHSGLPGDREPVARWLLGGLPGGLQPSGAIEVTSLTRTTLAETMAFRRGDGNADGGLDIADTLALLEHLFRRGPLACRQAADANDDGRVDVVDAIRIVGALFGERSSLPAPFPDCGVDPTPDALSCASPPSCPGG